MRYLAVPGVRVEPAGEQWAAWSPLSGETHLLNDESAAMLELLAEHVELTTQAAATLLAAETGIDFETLEAGIAVAWLPLEWAGLVRQLDATDT